MFRFESGENDNPIHDVFSVLRFRWLFSIKVSVKENVVSLAAVFSIVTQRSSPDDTKNGCEGD